MRNRRSAEEWQAIFSEKKALGLSDKEMQRRYNISSSSYSKNKRKYADKEENDFIKLESKEENNNQARISFPNGLIIEVAW